MTKYLIGALLGGVLGYFVLYKLIGCSSGSCPITANPYLSTIFGIILGLLLAVAVSSPTKSIVSEKPTLSPAIVYKKITAGAAKARIDSGDKIIILDVRTESEYKEGHIQNSILIPNETIADKKPYLLPDLDSEILVYCRTGNRSSHAAKKLIAIGYTKVYDFGGITEWPYATVTGP
jgi:rhodanese-related sulfurtransferase